MKDKGFRRGKGLCIMGECHVLSELKFRMWVETRKYANSGTLQNYPHQECLVVVEQQASGTMRSLCIAVAEPNLAC
jgi:hypothetical protein